MRINDVRFSTEYVGVTLRRLFEDDSTFNIHFFLHDRSGMLFCVTSIGIGKEGSSGLIDALLKEILRNSAILISPHALESQA